VLPIIWSRIGKLHLKLGRLVDRGFILIDGQTGDILWSVGPHPVRELVQGGGGLQQALPAFCDILE